MRFLLLLVLGVIVSSAWAQDAWAQIHLSTDKPIYRAGETIHLRGVLLDPHTRATLTETYDLRVELISPRGAVIHSGFSRTQDSALGAQLYLPGDAPGGTWTVTVSGGDVAAATRTIAVQALDQPRLSTVVTFRREAYGPGEELVADVTAVQRAGGPARGEPVEIVARIDGAEVHRAITTIDAEGNCQARFRVPAGTPTSGSLAVAIGAGAAQVAVTRPLPLVAAPPDVRMYPEGGYLVAGLPTRLYVESFRADGQPADIGGFIVDDLGQRIAEVASIHEGRSRTAFTPLTGRRYDLMLTRPVTARHPLPEAWAEGVMLQARDDLTQAGQPLRLLAAATTPGPHLIIVRHLRRIVAQAWNGLGREPTELVIPLPADTAGVLTATLLRTTTDGRTVALAERLVFRRPRQELTLSVVPERNQVGSDEVIILTITTRDQEGRPVSALVGLTASDDSVRQRVPRREQPPRLPAMALLETEVRDLADAGVYLDHTRADSAVALDLLLGTQGWRRFITGDPLLAVENHGQRARRALGYAGTERRVENTARVEARDLQRQALAPALPLPDGVTAPPPVEIPPAIGDNLDLAGREEAVNAESGSSGAFMAIGAGGGIAGMFGSRSGGGKRRALARFGGTRASESAVDAALRFLKRHQSPDGLWSLTNFPGNCTEVPKCQPGPRWPNTDGDVAATAQAVMVFLGTGYDHRTPNKYRTVVERGLAALTARQLENGSWTTATVTQALATQALCEAVAMTNDPQLRQSAQRAVLALRALAHDTHMLGWNDTLADGTPTPTLASHRAVCALRAALSAGLDVGQSLDDAKARLQRAWPLANGVIDPRILDPESVCFPARWNDPAQQRDGRQWLGMGAQMFTMVGLADDPRAIALRAGLVNERLPRQWPWLLLDVQAAGEALIRHQDPGWQRWNTAVRDPLIAKQVQGDGCADGSWDGTGTATDLPDGGRLFATAQACRILQVYYVTSLRNWEGVFRPVRVAHLSEHREYARRPPPPDLATTRPADTVYWHRGVLTDPATGSAVVRFHAGTAATLRITADAATRDGALGCAEADVRVVPAFAVHARFPAVLTQGDEVLMPVTARTSDTGASVVDLAIDAVGVTAATSEALVLGADGMGTTTIPVTATAAGPALVRLHARLGRREERLAASIDVQSDGFPWSQNTAGVFEPQTRSAHTLTVPADARDGRALLRLRVWPDTLFSALQAAEQLQAQPHGCFEQTSSTLYPMLMAQRLLLQRPHAPVALVRRGQDHIATGVKRLLGYEVPGGGFEWYGRAPAHPALTAYGLLQFHDAAAVQPIDPTLIARTRSWLLAQRDGQGGFRQHPHGGGRDPLASDAYILWALLTSAGDTRVALATDLHREIDLLDQRLRRGDNAYATALGANVFALAGRNATATQVRARLKPGADGLVAGPANDFLGSSTESLRIATTALACLAWSAAGEHDRARHGIRALRAQAHGARFGNTQATVLALRAILVHEAAIADQRPVGIVSMRLDDGETHTLSVNESEDHPAPLTITCPVGTHTLTLAYGDGRPLPWSVELAAVVTVPPSDPACALRLETSLSSPRVRVGEALECLVRLSNPGTQGVSSPIAIVPLPAGTEPDHEHLRRLVGAKRIAAYEIHGNAVVLYGDDLPPAATLDLTLSLLAIVPGRFSAPASRVYAYYADERKWWCAPLRLEIGER